MRHITWAAAWFLVGLTVVLGTASVMEQRAVADRGPAQTPPPAVAPSQDPAPRVKPAEGRQLVAYRHSAHSRQQQSQD